MILGLDISTSCTGCCILEESGKLIDMGAIQLSKKKCVYSKAIFTRSVLAEILKKHKIEKIYIEENLQSFRSGFSSAKTLSTLARFNGIVSFISFETFNLIPVHINVNAARKSLGIKIIRKKDGGKPTKEQVLSWSKKNVDFTWPEKILKSGPRKGQKVIDPICFDMADAYVIGLAGMTMNI